MTLEEAIGIVKPHNDKIVAQARASDAQDALLRLVSDPRFSEMWQVKDYVSAIIRDGKSADAALRSVFP